MILNDIGLPTQKKKSQEKSSPAKKETSATPPQKNGDLAASLFFTTPILETHTLLELFVSPVSRLYLQANGVARLQPPGKVECQSRV